MDVRLFRHRVVALADGTDDVAFVDRRSPRHPDLSELEKRDGVAACGANRHDAAAVRHCAREADRPARRSSYHRPDRASDVDSTVLAAGVRVATH
jgi:hypothetical protein